MNYCEECQTPNWRHLVSWVNEFMDAFLPPLTASVFGRAENFLQIIFERALRVIRLIRVEKNFDEKKISLRSMCFINEGRRRGWEFAAIAGPFGYTPFFHMRRGGRTVRFEGLPMANETRWRPISEIDDKEFVKEKLRLNGLPVLSGKSFWFFQKEEAYEFAEKTGFPLVVKPRGGTFARHITTNIRNQTALIEAIEKAVSYSPTFLIEEYFPVDHVYRATVVDQKFAACVKRTRPRVFGDGIHTIRELIEIKNSEPGRGAQQEENCTVYKVPRPEEAAAFLKKQNLALSAIPSDSEKIELHEDPFVRLGADLEEETELMHADNRELFVNVAKLFDVKLVGIDFLAEDISEPWRNQRAAILELNSIPCIEVHHFPTSGRPQNVASAVADMAEKYYQ